MSLTLKHKDSQFGVSDKVRVTQKIEEGGKTRSSIFEGMVLSIKGRDTGVSFLVRRMGEAGVGIERIFPIDSPTIESVEVIKKGMPGVRRAKLYYTRDKSPREIEEIYSRAHLKNQLKPTKAKHAPKKRK